MSRSKVGNYRVWIRRAMRVVWDVYKKWVGSTRHSKVGLQGLDKEGVEIVWDGYKKWVGSLWLSKVGLQGLDKVGVGVDWDVYKR